MRQILDADCGSDEDCLVLGAKRGNGYTQDELREACVLTSKLLPPRVFAKAVKTMIMQAQLLRGKALSAMQDEIKSVVSMATHEREAKRVRYAHGRPAQDAPEPQRGPLSLFLAAQEHVRASDGKTAKNEDEDCCDTDDTDRRIFATDEAQDGREMPPRAGKEEPIDDGFVDGVFAPACQIGRAHV